MRALDHHTKTFANIGHRVALQIPCGMDAHAIHLLRDAPTDAPHLSDKLRVERAPLDVWFPIRPNHHPIEGRMTFGQMIAKFSKGFGWRDADAGRYADPLIHPCPYLPPQISQRGDAIHTGYISKTFVNRVNLDTRYQRGDAVHHPA